MLALRVTMPDGSKWDVPAVTIAEHRARYYYPLHGKEDHKSLNDYVKEGMADHDEIKDWAANNMDWDDVKNLATKVEDRPLTKAQLQEGWINGEKEVLETSRKEEMELGLERRSKSQGSQGSR